MAIEFIQQKYDSKSKKVVESKIRPRQKIIELGGSLITNTKNISKSTGYLIVIVFWLVLITFLSSCYTVHPSTCNNLQVMNCPCTK